MPKVEYQAEKAECKEGDTLLGVLLEDNLTPHSGVTDSLNCRGHGTCGTCRIRVTKGGVGDNEMTTRLKISMDGEKIICN
jgi:ferredoxin